jgi:hypothetical protein
LAGRKRPLLQQQPAQSLSFGGPGVGTAAAAGEDEEEDGYQHHQGEEMDFEVPALGADEGGEEEHGAAGVKQEPVGDQDFSFATPGECCWVNAVLSPFQRFKISQSCCNITLRCVSPL